MLVPGKRRREARPGSVDPRFSCFENDGNATPTAETRRTQRKTPKSLCGLGGLCGKKTVAFSCISGCVTRRVRG